MKQLTCEMCGSTDLMKQDGVFVCLSCGCKYSAEEAKRMMVEGTVDVQGVVKVDNSAFVQKYLANARRAYEKEDWEEVEKYYNLVEQNESNNIEAVFFSAFGKAMLSLVDTDYYRREQKFNVLKNSISVINEYFEVTREDKIEVLKSITNAIVKMKSTTFVYRGSDENNTSVGGKEWQERLFESIRVAFVTELRQICDKKDNPDVRQLIDRLSAYERKEKEKENIKIGCGTWFWIIFVIFFIISWISGK